jgi:PBP1b-binding outer membrane lipoprotein LpoB
MARSNTIISVLLLTLLVSACTTKVDTAPTVENPEAPTEQLQPPPVPNPNNEETYMKESTDYFQWNFHKVLKVINAAENDEKKWTHLEVFFHSIELFMTVQPEQYLRSADKFRNDGEES